MTAVWATQSSWNHKGTSWPWPHCFTSTEARLLIRDGDGGWGVEGGGGVGWRGRESEGLTADTGRKDTGETVDRPQNNGSVKAVSPRHCAATSAPRNCCFNCRAWAETQGQWTLHYCWGTTRSERSLTFAAKLHLPAHDLFWANLRVQLHLPPLDLAWNPSYLFCCIEPLYYSHSHTALLPLSFI